MIGSKKQQWFVENMKQEFNICKTYRRACIMLKELREQYKNDERYNPEQIQELLTVAFHFSRFGTGS